MDSAELFLCLTPISQNCLQIEESVLNREVCSKMKYRAEVYGVKVGLSGPRAWQI